ncbi:MAG: BMC domain-containing protein [Lachnospiraceae bacterium]|nr:BMC domain-containing protein [Lachnospiraceae bacterium]
MKSLGFLEIPSVAAAVDALDTMCKTADVEFVTWERKMGGRLVTIILQGEVAAVTEAVESAVQSAILKPAAHAVIANPHEELWKIIELSQKKLRKMEQTEDVEDKTMSEV